MADKTLISWSEATWNPITGCSMVSPGCTHCYAMTLAGTRLKNHPSRKGLTRQTADGPVWTGEVRFNKKWLDQPLRWKKPRQIFVCAHGDLFHEDVPDEWIDRVFAVMMLAHQHTFQVLTKRAARMRRFLTEPSFWDRLRNTTERLVIEEGFSVTSPFRWPIPNVWLGVSVEDQKRAGERIPSLLDTPAAVRWISAEPLLGPVDIEAYLSLERFFNETLDWVVAGGESGPGSRPMHPDWARSIRDQCLQAGVPFHFKQWGSWAFADGESHYAPDVPLNWKSYPERYACLSPNNLRQSGYGLWGAEFMARVGKKKAGRILDGRTWDEYPS